MDINYKQHLTEALAERCSQMGAADSLARKPKTIFVLPESRQQKKNRERLGEGISELLDRARCMGFLDDDAVRRKMRELSSFINTPRVR